MENGSKIWPTGNEKRSNLMVGGGVLAGATKWLTIYAGAGYGARKLAWEDIAGNWALVSDWSHTGMAVEFGAASSGIIVRALAWKKSESRVSCVSGV